MVILLDKLIGSIQCQCRIVNPIVAVGVHSQIRVLFLRTWSRSRNKHRSRIGVGDFSGTRLIMRCVRFVQ